MKRWKTIRIIGIVLLVIALLAVILLAVGDHFLNRYLNNNDGREAINKVIPINGKVAYDDVSIHPFRDFPNVSLRLNGLRITDSREEEHKQTPLLTEKLFLNTSITSLSKKQLKVESIDFQGLTLNIYDSPEGYSNIASLLRKERKKPNRIKTKDGWSVEFDNSKLNIKDLQINRIEEIKQQKVHIFIDELDIKSEVLDSAFHLVFDIKKLKALPHPDKSWQPAPFQFKQGLARFVLNESFSEARLIQLHLNEGEIDLQTNIDGSSNFADLLTKKPKNRIEKQKGKKQRRPKPIKIDLNNADVKLTALDFALIDQQKKKDLKAQIYELESKIKSDPDTATIIGLHLGVNQLAFNTDKGAFLENSIVKGQVVSKFKNRSITFSSQDLSINEDTFDVQSFISLDKSSQTTLTIEKSEAVPSKIKPLLSQHIQKQITTYDVKGPMYAKAHLVFTPGVKKARVDLDMKVSNNTICAKGQVIKNANVSATFINGLYDDQEQYTENKKNARLLVHHLSGEIFDFQIDASNALITSSPERGSRLLAKANVSGKASTASEFLEHDRFSFKEGEFTMSTDIDASIDNLEDFIAGTDLHLEMKDMEVFYPSGNTSLPLNTLEMNKSGDKTVFDIEGFSVGGGSPIQIGGEVDHLASVLFPGSVESLQTKAKIRANSITWGGLIALFGKDGIVTAANPDSTIVAKRSMKQTLTGIQESFRPTVDVLIDTVHYGKEVQLLNFKTGLNFKEDRTLVLQKTSFDIDKSNVTLDGEVVINTLDFTKFDFDIELQHLDFDVLLPKFDYFGVHLMKQIHDQPDNLNMHVKLSGELDDDKGLKAESINAFITYESFAEDKFTGNLSLKANPNTKKIDVVFGHSGLPRNINYLLGSEDYIFDKGWFTISFEFDDNFESFAQMVEESKVGLTIADAEVLISDIGVTVPLSRIEVTSIDNNAYYYMLIKSDSLNQELKLDGIVKNIRHFAFNDMDSPYEVDLGISSPRIVWDNFKQILDYADNGKPKSSKIIKESLSKVLHDFNPNVKLKVDKLEYSDQLAFNNIYAHAYMDGNILKVDSANVAYGASQINAYVDIDMSSESTLPFNVNLGLTNIDIAHTLAYFDYFNRDELRSAKQIDGNVWLDLDMAAELDLEKGYDFSKTDADLRVVVQNLIVADMETINKITNKIGRKKRFEVLRFAPIHSNIKVKGRRIEIDETEIQSNAAHAFVEGTIDKSSSENLWISVPLNNLKKPDLDIIPGKTGYDATGPKLFFQWVTSESADDGKTKVRLSKKQFFQERSKVSEIWKYKETSRRQGRRKASKNH